MSFGRLAVLKMVGERPTFCILDKGGSIIVIIPDFVDWMLKRVGTIVSFSISDAHFQIVDEEIKPR